MVTKFPSQPSVNDLVIGILRAEKEEHRAVWGPCWSVKAVRPWPGAKQRGRDPQKRESLPPPQTSQRIHLGLAWADRLGHFLSHGPW